MPVPESKPAPRIGQNWRIAITVAVVLVIGGTMVAAGTDWSPRRVGDPGIPAPLAAEPSSAEPAPPTANTPSRSASATPRRSGPSPSTPAPSPSSPPTSVGMVDVRAVAANPNAQAVAGLFDRYFSGINDKQYAQVLALFDPSGFLNPNDPAQAKTFTDGVSTSKDSQVVLRSITDDAVAGDLDARLTLQSHQDPGRGPAGSPNETCTNWDITYQLRPAGSGYRIFKPQAVAHTPC